MADGVVHIGRQPGATAGERQLGGQHPFPLGPHRPFGQRVKECAPRLDPQTDEQSAPQQRVPMGASKSRTFSGGPQYATRSPGRKWFARAIPLGGKPI